MGGRAINDHSNWVGKSSKESPLPMESKMKQFSSAEGAGSVMRYEDTTEEIQRSQEKADKQIKNRPLKPNYRN
jgi:hypothetical protein